jgi:uncharacterized radical SAM superfamily Fe-S cluster-containing enzyme
MRDDASSMLPGPRFGQFVRRANRPDSAGGQAPVSTPMMAMVEVTNRCNMNCPVCFSDANHPADDVPLAEIRRRLERLLQVTEGAIPIQISGGEPTVRKDLPEIIALAKRMGFRNIELITNGIRISHDQTLLRQLKDNGLTAVYLQFDGLKRDTYLKIRGQDMTEVRQRAVEAARQASLCVTLAVAVTKGVNDGEIGDIVRYGIDNIDTVRAINFQSATRFTGRFELPDEHGGYSLPGILRLIEEQTGLPADTFRSEHMGHPLCNAMSLVFVRNRRLEPLFKYITREDMMRFLGDDSRDKLLALFRGKRDFFSCYLSHPAAWKLIAKAAPIFDRNPLNVLRSQHILLFAKSFMERDGLDPERINRCCYGITDAQGVFSFCAFNNLYRFPGRTRRRDPSPS